MTNLDMPQTLSARQIDWCRENIRSFSSAWFAVQNAEAHRRAVYRKLGLKPDPMPQRIYPRPSVAAAQQARLSADVLAPC